MTIEFSHTPSNTRDIRFIIIKREFSALNESNFRMFIEHEMVEYSSRYTNSAQEVARTTVHRMPMFTSYYTTSLLITRRAPWDFDHILITSNT